MNIKPAQPALPDEITIILETDFCFNGFSYQEEISL